MCHRFRPARSGIFNPATGEQIRQVVMSTAQETGQAIAAAQQAFPAWSRHSPLKRARVMFRFKALLEENTERLARLISEEHGKCFPTRSVN
jgi:malonate-semialdehyde dehydrogenase (acetylating)/methylmalonate-semialdehyde dehydrogenase